MLRVLGDAFDPDEFLATARLPVCSKFRKGEQASSRGRLYETSGFNCVASRDTEELHEQVPDAIAFLTTHADDLRTLADINGIESKFLDFGYACRLGSNGVALQGDYLPPELLRLAGSLGIGIALSLYPASSDDT